MPGERVNVEREIVVPEEPNEVWKSLTDPDRLEEWFASDVELGAGRSDVMARRRKSVSAVTQFTACPRESSRMNDAIP